jgi:Restriction endonuclease BglII
MLEKLVKAGFEVAFTNHADAILKHDFSSFVEELEAVLLGVSIPISEIVGRGGGEAKFTQRLRNSLADLGWTKHNFEITKKVDGVEKESISHEIDHVNRTKAGTLALEIEWNNKDPFFDRDLENFKRLHAEGAISIGGVVTRGSIMQASLRQLICNFAEARKISNYQDLVEYDAGSPTLPQRKQVEDDLRRGISFPEAWSRKFAADKYGQATTHWSKLSDRVARGVGNPCPLILIGLPKSVIDTNS